MVGMKRLVADSRQMTRRSFLAVLGWGAFLSASAVALLQSVRFIFPNATYEQPSIFKAEAPSAYGIGSTSDLIAQGLRGLRATKADPALPGFKCPCHGSRYYRDSVNFYGPAPRPMDHIHVEVSPDGRLLVDRASFVDLKFRLKV